MSFYLLATRDWGVQKAFRQSYYLSKKYWKTVLTYFGIVIGASLLLGCLFGVAGGAVGFAIGDPNLTQGVVNFAMAPLNLLIGLVSFIFMSSVFMTIDAHETGESFH